MWIAAAKLRVENRGSIDLEGDQPMKGIIRACRSGLLFAMIGYALSSLPAQAVCTSSFVDVPNTASYCTAAQWLKARSITLGCTDTVHFCPDDAVTRGQMALFLNRMGGALAPILESVAQNFNVSASSSAVVCQTNPVDMGGFNHVATGDASAYVSGSGAGQAQFRLVYSVDDGATWSDWATFYMPVTVTTDLAAASSTSSSVLFGGSQTALFGLQVSNTSNALVQGGCEVRARVENYNGVILF